jgi:MFS family permease
VTHLLLLALAVTCSFAMQVVFVPLQETAKLDLGLSDLQISLAQGFAASIPVALLAIPLGRLVDQAHRVRLLLAIALVWTAGVTLTAFASGFAMLFFGRMLSGVAVTFTLPIAISLAADLYGPTARGRALLLLSTGRIVGTAIAFAIGGSLLGVFAAHGGEVAWLGLAPWRSVQLAFGLASVVLILPLLLLREPMRRETSEVSGASLRPALQAIWARRALLGPLYLGQITAAMAVIAAGIWAAPVLTRDYGQQPADFAAWMGAILLLSGLIGSVLGGLSADWGYKGRVRGGLLGGAVAAALCAIPGALFALAPDLTAFGVLLGLLLTSGAITGLVTATAIAVLIPNDLRGVCLGVLFVIGALLGTGLAPTLVTLASSAFGGEAYLRYGLTTVAVVASVISALGYRLAARTERAMALAR